MFDNKKQKFLFKCEDCEMILSIDLDEEEELEKVNTNKMVLSCPCGGKCFVLRDYFLILVPPLTIILIKLLCARHQNCNLNYQRKFLYVNRSKFLEELSKLRLSSTFLTLKGYLNNYDELADYNIVFHISYESALKKSLQIVKDLRTNSDLEEMAKLQLVSSFSSSLEKLKTLSEEDLDSTYDPIYDKNNSLIKGCKIHTKTDTLYLFGLVVNKRVLMPGSYPDTNSNPLTIVKRKMRHLTPVGKFRQFKITPGQVDKIVVENISILPPL